MEKKSSDADHDLNKAEEYKKSFDDAVRSSSAPCVCGDGTPGVWVNPAAPTAPTAPTGATTVVPVTAQPELKSLREMHGQ